MKPAAFHSMLNALSQARRRWRLTVSLTGTFGALSILLFLSLLVLGLDRIVYLTVLWRYGCWFVLMASGAALLALAVLPWIVRRGDEWIARRLEIHNPGLENRLINSLQFSNEESVAEPFLETIAQSAYGRLNAATPSLGLDPRRTRFCAAACLIFAILFAAHFAIFPERTQNTLIRVLFPWSPRMPFYETRVSVEPGDAQIPEGASLPIAIQLQGKRAERAEILTSLDGLEWSSERIEIPTESMEVSHRFTRVTQPFHYTVKAGDGRSDMYQVTVLPRPIVESISLEYRYPDYTKKDIDRVDSVDGGIAVLKGTRIVVNATSDIDIEQARMNLRQGEKLSVIPARIVNGRCTTMEFTANENGFFSIKLFTPEGVDNADPVRYSITAIPDAPPVVTLPLPGRNLPDARLPSLIPCLAKARDDLGVAHMELICVNRTQQATQTIVTQTGGPHQTTLEASSILDVTSTSFETGQTLELFARAVDTLGQTAESTHYTIQLTEDTESTEQNRIPAKELASAIDEMREALEEHRSGEKDANEEKETLLGMLDEILQKQEEVIPPTKDLLEIPEEQRIQEQEDELERLAQSEKRILEDIKDFNEYLKQLAPQSFDDPSLLDEFNEIVDNVERAEESLIGNAVEIALDSEEAALNCIEKLDERIESELESWLPDKPDRTKWNLEDAPEDLIDDISLVDLPDELEDLIGELIEDEADVTEETEDLSSNWATADLEEGWDVMDGQISSFSAKGKTGNTLPDSTEATGRSGEGRTGKSNGEFVEKFAQHKDNRQTGPRMRDESFEDAVVQELDNKPPSQSTGGGKKSGIGPEGFTGKPPLTLQNKINRLAEKQEEIRNRAEALDQQLNNLYLSPKELSDSIEAMKEVEQDLQAYRLKSVMEKQRRIINSLSDIQKAVSDPLKSHVERRTPTQDDTTPVEGLRTERFPPHYAEALNLYFRSLSETP